MTERKTFSVRLRPDIMKSLKLLAVEEETPLAELLEQAIEELLMKHGKSKRGGITK